MRYKDQESAYQAMLEAASREFEMNLRLPHFTLGANGATGDFQVFRGEIPTENGLLRKVAEIGKEERRAR